MLPCHLRKREFRVILIRRTFRRTLPLREVDLVPVLTCALIASAPARERSAAGSTVTPLPSVAAEPYPCAYKDSDIPTPAKAVALMTGLDELDIERLGILQRVQDYRMIVDVGMRGRSGDHSLAPRGRLAIRH